VLVSIFVVTLLALWLDPNINYQGIASIPPSVTPVVGHVDLAGSFNIGIMGV